MQDNPEEVSYILQKALHEEFSRFIHQVREKAVTVAAKSGQLTADETRKS